MNNDMALRGLHYKRMRLRGDQKMLAREANKQRAQIEALKRQLGKAERALAGTEATIARKRTEVEALSRAIELVYGLDPDDGTARQSFPKRHISGWGALTRTLLALLRQWGVSDADQLAGGTAKALGLSFTSSDEWNRFRRQVGRTLQGMHFRGLLTRHHSSNSNQAGIWSLKDTSA